MNLDRALHILPPDARLRCVSVANYDGAAWYVRATYADHVVYGFTVPVERAVTSFYEPFSAARFVNRFYAERGSRA